MKTFAFIDASNLFYGGKKSLGWSIDYEKLLEYLKEKYDVKRAYFFGGVEIHHFAFDYLVHETVPIRQLESYLINLVNKEGERMTEARLVLLDRHLKRARFYRKLEQFGYILVLKPVKTYEDEDGSPRRKANCDVDMAYYLMRERDSFERALILSGDGDFLSQEAILGILNTCASASSAMTKYENSERHPYRMPPKSDTHMIGNLV